MNTSIITNENIVNADSILSGYTIVVLALLNLL